MIALPSIAFGGFSGSAKDVTARQVGGRSILSVRAWPTGQTTSAQVVRRASMAKITKSYKTLSTAQMLEWERLAAHTTGASAFGQKAQLSGVNLYVRLNVNRVMAGEAILSDAPASVVSIDAASCRQIIVAPSVVILNGIKHLPAPNKLVVKMSAPVSPGISNGWSKTVVLSSEVEDDWGGADVTEFYTKTIGIAPVVGQKVFVELYWVDTSTGFTGLAEKTSVVVMTDEDAAALIGGSRVRFTNEDMTSESNVDDVNIELSTGVPAFSVSIAGTGTPGVSQAEIYFNKPFPDDVVGSGYFLVRSTAEGKYNVSAYRGGIRNSREGLGRMTLNTSCNSFRKPFETVGVGVVV